MKLMLIGSSHVPIPPETGGAVEAIIYDIVRFTQKNNDVVVVSRKKTSNDIRYVIIPSVPRKNKFFYILQDMIFGLRCISAIRKNNPDIVHLHTTFVSFPILFFKRFLPKCIKIVYTSHSPAWTVNDTEIGMANRFFNRIEAYVMRRADIITVVSESQRAGILSRGVIKKEKIITISNYSRNMHSAGNWKRKNRIKGPVVLFVGKLTETKGLPYLIASVEDVAKTIKNVKFVIVGALEHGQGKLEKNPWERYLPPTVRENVIFTGPVHLEELKQIYASADVFVLPSLREGMPLVVLEAVANGLPIIATRVSGTKEVLNKKCAIFVKRKDSTALVKAIIKILSNKNLAQRMSAESKRISKKFEMNTILEKYQELYRSMEGR